MNGKAKLIGIGDLFRQTWGLYRERVWSLFGILIVGLVITIGVILGAFFVFESVTGEEASTVALVAITAIALIPLLIFWMISGLAMIYAIPQDVGISSAYGLAFRNLISFGWLSLLRSFVVLGGVFMLIVPATIFSVWFTFASYIFAFDRERGMNALLKSRSYVSGYWWQIVGRLAVVLVAYILFVIVVSLLVSLLGETVGGIVSAIFEILASIFWLLVLYILYQNLKSLKPEVASQPATGPRGFFRFSIAWGILGLVVSLILFFKLGGPDYLLKVFEAE